MPTSSRPHGARPAAIAACLLAAGALLPACGDAVGEDAVDGTPPATAACAEVEFPPLQFGSHLIGDAEPPVPYSSTPPTSGWHLSGEPPKGVATSPLGEVQQVATLEVGGVVVTYRDLPDADVRALEEVVADRYADRVALTSYDGLGAGEVAFTSWGALQRCTALDLDALAAYVEAYAQPIRAEAPRD